MLEVGIEDLAKMAIGLDLIVDKNARTHPEIGTVQDAQARDRSAEVLVEAIRGRGAGRYLQCVILQCDVLVQCLRNVLFPLLVHLRSSQTNKNQKLLKC